MPVGEYGSVMFTPETLRTQFPSNLLSTTAWTSNRSQRKQRRAEVNPADVCLAGLY